MRNTQCPLHREHNRQAGGEGASRTEKAISKPTCMSVNGIPELPQKQVSWCSGYEPSRATGQTQDSKYTWKIPDWAAVKDSNVPDRNMPRVNL